MLILVNIYVNIGQYDHIARNAIERYALSGPQKHSNGDWRPS